MYFSLALNSYNYLNNFLSNGSTDVNITNLVDVDYVMYNIPKGIHYLDDIKLQTIIKNLYKHKTRDKILYITGTAVCHVLNMYSKIFLSYPLCLGDFGITDLYQTICKTFIGLLISRVVPLIYLANPISLIITSVLTLFVLKLFFSNLNIIKTSPVKNFQTQIPGKVNVIIINNRDRLILNMPRIKRNEECWLPGQMF